MNWASKLDHDVRFRVEKLTKHVEGQHDGQETAAIYGGLKVPGFPGTARLQDLTANTKQVRFFWGTFCAAYVRLPLPKRIRLRDSRVL